jgi:hypothetical protein
MIMQRVMQQENLKETVIKNLRKEVKQLFSRRELALLYQGQVGILEILEAQTRAVLGLIEV